MLTRCRDIQAETYYLRYLQDGVQCKDADTQFNVQYSSLSSYLLFWLFFFVSFFTTILVFLFHLHILFSHTLSPEFLFCPYLLMLQVFPPFPSLLFFFFFFLFPDFFSSCVLNHPQHYLCTGPVSLVPSPVIVQLCILFLIPFPSMAGCHFASAEKENPLQITEMAVCWP